MHRKAPSKWTRREYSFTTTYRSKKRLDLSSTWQTRPNKEILISYSEQYISLGYVNNDHLGRIVFIATKNKKRFAHPKDHSTTQERQHWTQTHTPTGSTLSMVLKRKE